MARVQFVETVLIPGGAGGTMIPVSGAAATPHIINSDGTEGAQAAAYIDRTSLTHPTSLTTNASGTVSFWLDSGDYNVHIDDQQSPSRFTSYIRGFTAPVIDTNQLVVAAQNLIQYTGDTKFSLQTADHGLKADGTYEWLIVKSDADGGGRKIDHALYPGIHSLLGSPTPDGAGMIRLPNISGRALIAAGAATGLTPRNLLDFIGSESHGHSIPGLSVPALSVPALSIPILALNVNSHSHPLTNAGGVQMESDADASAHYVRWAIDPGPNFTALREWSEPLSGGTFSSGSFAKASTPLIGNTAVNTTSGLTLASATGTGSTGTGTTGASSSGGTSSFSPSAAVNLFVKS